MNENDIVVLGVWNGSSYSEFFAIVRDINPASIDTRYVDRGAVYQKTGVRNEEDASTGDDYWRSTTPADFTAQSAVSGQVVWVSYAREESNSRIYQGLVLSSLSKFGEGGDIEHTLRVAFSHRTRTLLPQVQASACDSFWAVEEPAPVYCDDD